ncbi:MAG TPA: iron-sulfur cluster assembly accessory protein [Thermoplasmata archaeon]|nr:iron-sulfur cluster assembly accessory protein [Thermoplasmata archaeon]
MPPEVLVVTKPAAEHLRAFLSQKGFPPNVRVTVERTHCMGGRGHAYRMEVDEQARVGDVEFTAEGLKFLVDGQSADLLRGTRLELVEHFGGTTYHLENPNARGKCPCGHHDLFE